MPAEIYLVKVGMTMTEGTVEEWYVADGTTVEPGDMLYRLETEKINLDVDAETAGTVKHLVEEGTTLEPGAVVGFIFEPDEEIPAVLPTPAARVEDAPTPTEPEPKTAAPSQPTKAEPRSSSPAAPAARRLAAELDINLDSVVGTGPRGRITREDVEKAAASEQGQTTSNTEATTQSQPLRGMRKTIAERMYASLASTAQLTIEMEVAMDEAVKLRTELIGAWEDDSVRVSYTDLIILAAAKALGDHPRMNSSLVDDAIVEHGSANVGMAVALDEGLVVPVIQDVNGKDLKSIARESAALAQKAREGSLGLDDMQGGTFTVTSLGMFGVDGFTPILNAPQSGILGVGRIYDGLAWDGNTPRKRQCMRLSLTWDHRVLDGAPAAEFLTSVRKYLEAPFRLLVS